MKCFSGLLENLICKFSTVPIEDCKSIDTCWRLSIFVLLKYHAYFVEKDNKYRTRGINNRRY